MLIQDLKVDFIHSDCRGIMVQLFHGNCGQVNVLTCNKGTERGNHYHKIASESFYVVSGKVEVFCTCGEEKDYRSFSGGQFFMIKPFVMHRMTFPEDCILVAIYDICVERPDGTKDIYREDL